MLLNAVRATETNKAMPLVEHSSKLLSILRAVLLLTVMM